MSRSNRTKKGKSLPGAVTKNQVFVVATVVFLFLAVSIFLLIKIELGRILAKVDEFEEKKLFFEEEKKVPTRATEYGRMTEGFNQDLYLLDRALIQKNREVEFIQSLEKIAQDTGNRISISPHTPSKKKGPIMVPAGQAEAIRDGSKPAPNAATGPDKNVYLSIQSTGNYRQFLDFYYRLANSSYLFNIESFSLVRPSRNVSLKTGEEIPADRVEGRIVISFEPK